MKALVYHGPEDMRIEDRDLPEPAAGEAVLRVGACGICGTDLRILAGSHRAYQDGVQRVPGHEVAGTIGAAGTGAGVQVGQTVFVAPNIGCMACPQCLGGRVNLCRHPRAIGITEDGAMAEFVVLPRELIDQGNVLPVDDPIDMAALALVEPLACVLRGSRAVAIEPGDLVLLYGAGPIGLLHLQVARLRSPSAIVVCEPSADRREQATVWGADYTTDPAGVEGLIEEVSDGQGADATIVAAPAAAAQEQAIQLGAIGGRINFFAGLPSGRSRAEIDSNLIHYRELIVTGTTANSTEDCREALDLVTSGAIDTARLISQRRPLNECVEAFAAARSGQNLKVVFEP